MKGSYPLFGRLLAVAVACACLSGCFGKPPPVERYLRVRVDNPPCQGQNVGNRSPIALKSLQALENLDRTAVMTAYGPVLTPSLQFYWEGTPQDIVGQALRQGIECQSRLLSPVDYQPRIDRVAVLSGQIRSFNVEETGGGKFVINIHLDLWSKDGRTQVAMGDFNAYSPLMDFRGATVAHGASDALKRIIPKVVAWLDASLPRLEKANQQQ